MIALTLAALLLSGCSAPPTVSAPAGIGATLVPTTAPTEEIATPALSETEGPVLSQAEAEAVTLDSLEMVDDY
ncbi:MAG: hypothetical protein DRJ03_30830, partial [Chloroflexi bacterium]